MTTPSWATEVKQRIDILLAKLAQMSQFADELGLEGSERDAFLGTYRDLLDQLYSRDLRLAELVDNSDLLVGAEGPRLSHDSIPVTAVISLLDKTRSRVLDVVKTIAAIAGRVPGDLQPRLHGLAPGSIYLGFSAPTPPDEGLFGADTPYFAAVKSAMRTIRLVGHLVAEEAPMEQIAEAVPDPGTRDAAVAAIGDLAPSQRSTYERLVIGGSPEMGSEQVKDGSAPAVLDAKDRTRVVKQLGRPVTTTSVETFIGTIREMDLDKQRFYLRQVEGLDEKLSVRGVYSESQLRAPREFLGRRVRVRGNVEKDPEGRPKLLFVDVIEAV